MKTKPALLLLALVATVSTLPVHAAAVDVTAVTADISAQLVPIGLIGAGVMLVVVAIKAFQWVRRAMS